MTVYADGAYENAVLLVPGWRHSKTKRLHIRRDCRAVMFHSDEMQPVLVRFDYEKPGELARLLAPSDDHVPCRWCFPGSSDPSA